MIEQYSGLRNN